MVIDMDIIADIAMDTVMDIITACVPDTVRDIGRDRLQAMSTETVLMELDQQA
jgi:hypothetical protein